MSSEKNTTAAPAGWYRDPLGLPQVRWWNGISWTNRVEERRPEIHLASADTPALAGAH